MHARDVAPPQPIDWSTLVHAYGPAEDTPGLIERLRDDDWEEAATELFGSILHQGGVYPATIAALPLLVHVALSPDAPGRVGSLRLLRAYTEAVATGAGRDSTHLPAGTDLELFDQRARSAARDAVRALVPILDDPDARIREAAYGCVVHVDDRELVAEIVGPLRSRLGHERDVGAASALVEPLIRLGAFDAEDFRVVVAAGADGVIFAAAWCAVATGTDLPGAVEHLVRLWPGEADRYPGGGAGRSLDALVRAAGPSAVPALRSLRDTGSVPVADLATAWVGVAESSRSTAGTALDALLGLVDEAPPTGAAIVLAGALGELRHGARGRTPEVCDGVARLVGAVPAPGAVPDPDRARVLATGAAVLFGARDPRWTTFAEAVLRAPDEPHVEDGTTRVPFSLVFGGASGRRDPAWAHRELVSLAGRAITAWPGAAPRWLDLVAGLPQSDDTVRIALASVALAPSGACRVLAKAAAHHSALFTIGLRRRTARALRSVRPDSDAAEAWLLTTWAVLDPHEHELTFEEAWELVGGDGRADAELLAVWVTRYSPAVRAACLRLLDGSARTSHQARECQLVAARAVAEHEDVERMWPTLLAVADAAGRPFAEAVALGNELVGGHTRSRTGWVDLLRDVAGNGRPSWSGPDHHATAVAVRALWALGAISPEDTVDWGLSALTASISSGHGVRVAEEISEPVREASAPRPALRARVAAALAPVLESDARVPGPGGGLADDVRLRAALREITGTRTVLD